MAYWSDRGGILYWEARLIYSGNLQHQSIARCSTGRDPNDMHHRGAELSRDGRATCENQRTELNGTQVEMGLSAISAIGQAIRSGAPSDQPSIYIRRTDNRSTGQVVSSEIKK